MPDLLFLAQRLPYPPTKGEKIRSWQIFRYLAQRYRMHLGCLIDDPDDVQHVAAIGSLCRDIHVATLDRKTARFTCLSGLMTNQALSVAFFRDRTLAAWVAHVVDTVRPAAIVVSSGNMAPYILDLPKRETRIVDLVDVDSEKWHAYAETSSGPMRLVYHREWRKVAALERRIATECDVCTLVSEAEAALFKRLVPELTNHIYSLSNGVDHRYFDPEQPCPPVYDISLPTFVFTGTMDYPPNVDAVTWFVSDILPLIRRTVPAAQFYIVGAGPGPAVQRLAAINGVFVTGRVPDVRPYIAHATVSVAPMRIARGIQNKVLEAMAMGKPVVLTAGALEGIEAAPGTDLLLADTAEAFALACCRLVLTDDGPAIGAAARSRILCDYDWSVRLRRLDDLLRPLTAPR